MLGSLGCSKDLQLRFCFVQILCFGCLRLGNISFCMCWGVTTYVFYIYMRMRLYGCLYLSYIHTYIRTYVRTSVYLCRNIFTQTYSIQPTSRTQRPSLTQANHHRHECSPCLRPWSKFMKRAVAPISAAVLRSGWLRVQDEQMLISPPSGSEGGYVLRANIYIYRDK